MINGNINEFMDKLWDGEELIYVYNGKKYFSQGYSTDKNIYVFELQMWEPKEVLLWRICGKDNQESFEEFLKTPLFDGKTFWEIESNVEWVDF
ncbi:MAG: hypothetical protein Q4C42_04390 [Clostridia bacterium]|nr:hypothetical protein [Clostridia bacterium]